MLQQSFKAFDSKTKLTKGILLDYAKQDAQNHLFKMINPWIWLFFPFAGIILFRFKGYNLSFIVPIKLIGMNKHP
jgi:hypothetical protein